MKTPTSDREARDTEPTKAPIRVIRPRRVWLPPSLTELWSFREMLTRFCARDITLRYRQTVLGVIWVLLVPLLGAGVLSYVFGTVAGLTAPNGIPYYLFALSGLVVWTMFSQVVVRSSAALLSNAALVGKVYFPRILLPVSVMMSTLVDVGISIFLLVILLVFNGTGISIAILALPVWLVGALALSLGLGLAAGALVVRYRDVNYVLPVAVQLLLFASPVAYSLTEVPSDSQWVYELNPLTGLLEGARWSLLDTPAPSVWVAAYSLFVSCLALFVGSIVFSRMERQFADVI